MNRQLEKGGRNVKRKLCRNEEELVLIRIERTLERPAKHERAEGGEIG